MATRLPNPTMSIFRVPKQKPKAKAVKAPRPAGKGESAAKKAPVRPSAKPSTTTSSAAARPASASAKDLDPQGPEDAAARLERSLASLEADKRENSYGAWIAFVERVGRLTSVPVL
jgi:RNA polymerase II elongation factor ELL